MSEKKRKRTKHRAVLPYITTPLLYLLASLVIIVPLCFILLNYSVSLVHKAQPSFGYSISDIELNTENYKKSTVKTGTVSRPALRAGDKAAELSCSAAGLKCDVFYGNNRISLRGGAGLKTDILPGDTGVSEIYGDRADAFRAVKNLKVGDRLVLDTTWGEYVYCVSDIKTGTEPPEETMPQSLLLVTANDEKVFSNLNEEMLYILADIESGPQLEEVRNEQ